MTKKPATKKPATKQPATKPLAPATRVEAPQSERAAVVAWAQALVKGGAAPAALRQKLDARPSLLGRFGLDALERQIVELAWAVERSLALADALRPGGGLTVERVRGWLGDGVDAALSPKKALRRHALVAVGPAGTVASGAAAASDPVRLGPGLAPRLDGAAEPDALWLGVCRIAPGGRGDVPGRVATLLADLDAAVSTLLTLDGCPRRETHELALGLSRRLQRGVLLVDGELLADAPDPALLLACARREADCDGDALVVCEAAALGERWRAAIAPPLPLGAPALLVLADRERTRDPVAAAPFTVRRLTLHAPMPATVHAPHAAAGETPAREPEPAPVDDGLEHIRQLAIRDAERALGIFRAPPPPPRAPVKPEPPRPAPPSVQAGSPRPAPPPVQVEPPKPAPPPVRAEPPKAEPLKPPPSPATEPGKRRSAKGAQFFGGEYAPQPERARAAAPAATPPAAPAPVATPAPAAATPTPGDGAVATEPDGAPIPVADNASLDELARVATTSPSAAQRIALIGKIRSVKSAAVVAALRANAASAHPGVRAAAEAAMAALFGANWNVTRAVAKPVQPPPSDDKDRGPPGSW